MYDWAREAPAHMTQTISAFLRQQLTAQQLSEREFSDRSGLGLSHVYQILRGERKHTRGDTIDKIATGLGMTPAEMAVAMGRAGGIDPDETELLAIYRQVPAEERPTVKSMIRGLTKRRTHHVDHDAAVTEFDDALVDIIARNSPPPVPVAKPQRRYESQSVKSQIGRYGFLPASV